MLAWPCQVIGECWIVSHVFFCLRFGVHIPMFYLVAHLQLCFMIHSFALNL
jgi:hypothetical protein